MISYEALCQALDKHNAVRRRAQEMNDLEQKAQEPPAEQQPKAMAGRPLRREETNELDVNDAAVLDE